MELLSRAVAELGDLADGYHSWPSGGGEAHWNGWASVLESSGIDTPLDLLVWRAFDGNQALSGKQIAARTGQEYGPKLKYLLLNMEDRGLLTHDTGVGYTRIAADDKATG